MLPDNAVERMTESDQLEFAAYGVIRGFTPIDEAVDGWKSVYITSETEASVLIQGLMYILPTGAVPMSIELESEHGSTVCYTLRVGVTDKDWASMSESKQWNAMHLYANDDLDPVWKWRDPMTGSAILGSDL